MRGRAQTWAGASYDRISGPQLRMGRPVVARLALQGDEALLDAGCGSGRVTELALAELPRGTVFGVDASASMIQAARERFSREAQRVQLRQLDLLELSLQALDRAEPFDAVLSTATFHWISDHQALFRRLRGVLRPGGRLAAQCGGEGNIATLRELGEGILGRPPYIEHMRGWQAPWSYAGPEVTKERLHTAGFGEARAWLEPSPQTLEEPREFLRTIIFGPHLKMLPGRLGERFLDELLAATGEPVVVDYVRLNIQAIA